MKAMFTAFAAIIVIGLLAEFGLNAIAPTTADVTSASESVRLD